MCSVLILITLNDFDKKEENVLQQTIQSAINNK